MPRDGSGVYSPPAGTLATAGTTIESAKYNAYINDQTTDANTARPIVAGGTGATTAPAALVALGITATAAEINVLDGLTTSTAELNVLDGMTATTAELNFVDGVTSPVQTQLDGKLSGADGSVTFAKLALAAVVTSTETITANNNDTTIPTSAAVAALVAAGWETRSTFNRTTDVTATSRAETFEDGYDYLVLARAVSRSDTAGLACTLVFESTSTATDTETLTVPLGVAASLYAVVIEIGDPRSFQPLKVIDYSSAVMTSGALTTGTTRLRATYGLGGGPNDTRTDRLNSISIDLPLAVDAGFMWILRRPRT